MKKKFCPKCKSINVREGYSGVEKPYGLPSDFKCLDCGYEAVAFPEK